MNKQIEALKAAHKELMSLKRTEIGTHETLKLIEEALQIHSPKEPSEEEFKKLLIQFAQHYYNLTPPERCTVHPPKGEGMIGLYEQPIEDILRNWLEKYNVKLLHSKDVEEKDALKWVKEKPKYDDLKPCIILTRHKFRDNEDYEYSAFEIKRIDFEDTWYWGLCTLDGDEYGGYDEDFAPKELMIINI